MEALMGQLATRHDVLQIMAEVRQQERTARRRLIFLSVPATLASLAALAEIVRVAVTTRF